MKIARFVYDKKEYYGLLDAAGEKLTLLEGSPFGGITLTTKSVKLSEVRLLPPTSPSKVVCVGLNYREHAAETNHKVPTEPVIFIKPTTCIIANGEAIEYPAVSKQVDFECELAVVIGKKAKNIGKSEAANYILGYACANDVTARDLQPHDGQWAIAKGFDTFLPYGPWVATDLDPSALDIKTLLNGEVKQSSNTRHFIFDIGTVLECVARVMTLLPGDVVITGTPSGIGPMQKGDVVTVEIEGIGSLVNPVR